MEENAKSEEESFKTPGERIVKLCEKQQISQRGAGKEDRCDIFTDQPYFKRGDKNDQQ